LALGLSAAWASTIDLFARGTRSDGSLAAEADFTTGAGFIDVTLTNLLAANVIRSAGQALSDVTFTLSGAPGTLGATTASGQQGNVSGAGLVTYTSGSPERFLGIGGGLFDITGKTITMEAIGGGKPSQMIVPFVADGGTLSNVNNGFQQFSPYTIGPATFHLDLSGVTADTTVTSATFSFGTGPDTDLPGDPVPLPAGLMLFGSALSGLLCLGRRRKI
jgi:hypothetical protein